jgi:hypothetical protein
MMKKFAVVLTLSATFLISCTKDNINEDTQRDTPEMTIARTAIDQTNKCLISGQWQVGQYVKENINQTKVFDNYLFNFTSIGHIVANRDGLTASGDWATSYVDDRLRVSFNFSSAADLKTISDDWSVIECTNNVIKLQNVLDNNEILTLVK